MIDGAVWGMEPEEKADNPAHWNLKQAQYSKPDGGFWCGRTDRAGIMNCHQPGCNGWILMAMEACDGTLAQWTKIKKGEGGLKTAGIQAVCDASLRGKIARMPKAQTSWLLAEDGRHHEALAKGLMFRLLKNLEQQHKHGMLHFDLKPDNICYVKVDGLYYLRFIDYGVARPTASLDAGRYDRDFCAGTEGYRPPKAPDSWHCDESWDVYSMGMIMYVK